MSSNLPYPEFPAVEILNEVVVSPPGGNEVQSVLVSYPNGLGNHALVLLQFALFPYCTTYLFHKTFTMCSCRCSFLSDIPGIWNRRSHMHYFIMLPVTWTFSVLSSLMVNIVNFDI